jgi:pilus assembly protein CpaE
MGNDNSLANLDLNSSLVPIDKIAVFARPDQIENLKAQAAANWIGDAELVPVAIDEELPLDMLRRCEIAIVEVDAQSPVSMRRVDAVRRLDSQLTLIAAMESATVQTVRTMVRAGVTDVVSLPLSAEEILQTILAVIEVRAEDNQHVVAQAPVIAVSRAVASGGATTLGTHLAAALANGDGDRPNVCLIDLDIQYGRVTEVLDLNPRRTLSDLLSAGLRLDGAFLESITAKHRSGVAVVAAPIDIIPLEALETERLEAILRVARREYDYVVIDMPANLTNWSLSLLSGADRVLMLVEQSISSLRQARRRIDLFRSLGLDANLLSVVVNRAEKRLFGSLSVADIEEALRRDVVATLPSEPKVVPIAQEQGLLAGELRSKSAYAVAVRELAEDIVRDLPMDDAP